MPAPASADGCAPRGGGGVGAAVSPAAPASARAPPRLGSSCVRATRARRGGSKAVARRGATDAAQAPAQRALLGGAASRSRAAGAARIVQRACDAATREATKVAALYRRCVRWGQQAASSERVHAAVREAREHCDAVPANGTRQNATKRERQPRQRLAVARVACVEAPPGHPQRLLLLRSLAFARAMADEEMVPFEQLGPEGTRCGVASVLVCVRLRDAASCRLRAACLGRRAWTCRPASRSSATACALSRTARGGRCTRRALLQRHACCPVSAAGA